MVLSLVVLALSAASPANCHSGVINKVVRDNDADEPFVLVTSAGVYRLAGQDFIHPRTWHSGEQLEICAQPGPGAQVEITNVSRSEQLAGQLIEQAVRPATVRR